jgi:hypothetical protein
MSLFQRQWIATNCTMMARLEQNLAPNGYRYHGSIACHMYLRFTVHADYGRNSSTTLFSSDRFLLAVRLDATSLAMSGLLVDWFFEARMIWIKRERKRKDLRPGEIADRNGSQRGATASAS